MLEKNQILQNRYRIVRQLGSGGMGAVYEAIDERFGQPIALKEIIVEVESSYQKSLIFKAFEREAKSLAIARHEVVPFVRDYFSEEGGQFLVMELVEGEDLADMLKKRNSPFPVGELISWMEQLLDALDYLHNLHPSIIHRDIKPQNLKITARQKIKLLDFGIAKSSDKNSTLTAHTFVGATLHYSPIEQMLRVMDETFRDFIVQKHKELAERIIKQETDARSDIFALGGTFYHLMTNQVPIDSLKRILSIWDGKGDPLANPMELNPEIPPILSYCLMKALEVDRRNRYATAREMSQDLSKAVNVFRQSSFSPKPTISKEKIDSANQVTIVDNVLNLLQPQIEKIEESPAQPTQDSAEIAQETQPQITQPSNLISQTSTVEITTSSYENISESQPSMVTPLKQLDTDVAFVYELSEKPKTPWHANKILIGFGAVCITALISGSLLLTFSNLGENVPSNQNIPGTLFSPKEELNLPQNELVYLPFAVNDDFSNQAKSCYEKKNYQCTIDNLTKLIKSSPKHAMAINNRGVAYFQKANYGEAIDDFSYAIKISPLNPTFFHNRSLAYSKTNNKTNANLDDEKVKSLLHK